MNNPIDIENREYADDLANEIYWKVFFFLDNDQSQLDGMDAGAIATAAEQAAKAKILEILNCTT